MSDRRAFAGLLLSAALAVSATAASAQQIYQMSGKFARSNGAFVNIPQVGDSTGNCASIVQGSRTTITMTPATKTPTWLIVPPNPTRCR